MKPQEAYHRLKDGLQAVKEGFLGTVDHYIGRGVETIHETQPGTPVRVETRVPAAEYSGTPKRQHESLSHQYQGGLGSRVIRMNAEYCNINMNPISDPRSRRRERRSKARKQKNRR